MDGYCPQCKCSVICSESRLVQDSCGHIKCRICLLADSTQCLLCWQDNKHAAFPTEMPRKIQAENLTTNELNMKGILGDPSTNKCIHCKTQYKSKHNCKLHKASIRKAKHMCDICDKEFIKKSQLEYHKLSHLDHNPFSCTYCGKGFKNRGKLNRHMKTHSDSKEQWLCKVCKKALLSIESLKKHMKIHTGEKNFPCDLCDKRFIEKNDLLKHQITHSDNKMYVCENCHKSFKRKYDLALHIKSHQPLRRFNCNQCDKIFFSLHNIRRHMRGHSNQKSFECNDCSKFFTRKDNLERHVKSVHLEEMLETNSNGLPAIEEKDGTNEFLAIEGRSETLLAIEGKAYNTNGRLLAIEGKTEEHFAIEESTRSYHGDARDMSTKDNIVPINKVSPISNRVSVIQRVPVIVRPQTQISYNSNFKTDHRMNDSLFKQPFPVKSLSRHQ